MIFYITLFLVFWALIFTAARFLQYFRITREYTDQTTAKVIRVRRHEPGRKREAPALDVVMEYVIDGKPGTSEVIVPADRGEEYKVGSEIPVRYHVSDNGAVHIASAGDGPRRLMYGYLAAIVLELVIYAVIWKILL